MGENIFSIVWEMLCDRATPENRIMRKSFALAVLLGTVLAYYRHAVRGFSSGEALFVTLGLTFTTLVGVGFFGGMISAGLYNKFRQDVGATKEKLTFSVFLVEWLIALAAPLFVFAFFATRTEPW